MRRKGNYLGEMVDNSHLDAGKIADGERQIPKKDRPVIKPKRRSKSRSLGKELDFGRKILFSNMME